MITVTSFSTTMTLMLLFNILLLLTALNCHCWAFRNIALARKPAHCSTNWGWATSTIHPFLSSSAKNNDEQEAELPTKGLSETSTSPSEPRVVRRNLDPLVASLTRMDDETRNAKRMTIPIWGELILDKSLMVFIPVALFAVIGFGMSIYVAVNSQDAIVDVLMDASSPEYLKGVSASTDVDLNACRGLCGSQNDNLEALRGIMSGFGGNK
jgi:hypothetical protein